MSSLPGTMQIVVLAGGRGTRLRPLTDELPKSMIPILGKPFLQHQIELFKRNGITDIVLCVGYLADKIKDYFGDGSRIGVRIRYSVEKEGLLGTAGALRKAGPLLQDVFFLTYGDSYLRLGYASVMEGFRSSGTLGLMAVYRNFDRYDKSNVVVEAGFVKAYDKREPTAEMTYIDYGLSALRRAALTLIPSDTVVDLQDFYKALIDCRQLLAYEAQEHFYEIGSPRGLEEFRLFAASLSSQS